MVDRCFLKDQCSSCTAPNLTYSTSIPDHSIDSCGNETERTHNAFTSYNPQCIKCFTKNTQMATVENNVLHVHFPPKVGSSETYWVRVGNAALSSCLSTSTCSDDPVSCSKTSSCCPPVGNGKQGVLDAWVFFPEEDASMQNFCNWNEKQHLKRTFPFYHGGKLFGVCSSKCPTGNTKDEAYNTDWTIRLMFREQGRLVLLYSVPVAPPFHLQPVAPQLESCCPNQDCSQFTSSSTDQYWYATKNKQFHSYRLAEYTMNTTGDASCCTAYEWPNNFPNPIDQILEYGKWNFLRMKWDVDNGTVQVYHTVDNILSSPAEAPTYTPQEDSLEIVLNTPPHSLPFQGQQPAKSFYFQPFFGGSQPDWLPIPLKDCDDGPQPSTITPTFSFGDFFMYTH